ncbi:MAG: DM13 domain-containing protein [Actinomycetota bacterium]|nr:DM13 domain-containing protein [Actinomycetota bacterium]
MLARLRRPAVLVPTALVLVAVMGVGLYLFQPWRLFVNTTVDEASPLAVSTPAVSPPAEDDGAATTPAPEESPSVAAQATVIATGEFISHEHGTSGTVSVIALPGGDRVLRIEGLDTSNGPDLHVWLSDAPVIEGRDGWFVFDDGDYADLGELKGNRGNQNYRIPATVDLGDLTSVTIWCDRFSVSFGAAELVAA